MFKELSDIHEKIDNLTNTVNVLVSGLATINEQPIELTQEVLSLQDEYDKINIAQLTIMAYIKKYHDASSNNALVQMIRVLQSAKKMLISKDSGIVDDGKIAVHETQFGIQFGIMLTGNDDDLPLV
jgi:hypothetical protein